MNFRSSDCVRACADIREELQPYILSQYSASPVICSILGQFRKKSDPQRDLEGFYDTIFALERVGEYGMDIWGRILNISRTFIDEATGVKYTLDGENYKLLLWMKALANISAADLSSLNTLIEKALKACLGEDAIQAVIVMNDTFEDHSMHVRIFIDGVLDEITRVIIMSMLPQILPAGVGYALINYDTATTFGFEGSELQPFDEGVFVGDDVFTKE